MEQYLAILVVLIVAALFYGVSILKKRKLTPLCDRFAYMYCALADRLLDDLNCRETLRVDMQDGGLVRIRPLTEQPVTIQAILKKPVDDSALADMRDLFFLRDEIQSHASNGSFSKDKYNAITNQLYESLHTVLSIVKNPSQVISQKDLDQIHYFINKQAHIRNITLAAVVSRACGARISIS